MNKVIFHQTLFFTFKNAIFDTGIHPSHSIQSPNSFFAMALYSYPPSPALVPFIRVFRVVDFVFEHAKDLPFKPYPPRPEHCLSFYPRDTEVVEYADSTKKISNVRSALIGMHHVVTNRYVGQHFLLLQAVMQ